MYVLRSAVRHRGYQRGDALGFGVSQHIGDAVWNVLLAEYPGSYRVVYVVVYVGDDIGKADYLPFLCLRRLIGVLQYTVPYLIGQVQPFAAVFKAIDHSQALLVVVETVRVELIEHSLSSVSERCMSEVVPEGNRFGEVLIELQGSRHSSCYLRDLKRMGKSCSVMVACG